MGKRYSVGNKVSVLATHFDAQNTTTAEKWSFQTYVNEWRIARCEGEITRRDCEQNGLGVYIVCYLRIIQCVWGEGKG